MSNRNWDEHWKARVHLNAAMSTCVRLKVGAVAVRNRRSFADAYNGNIPGETHCDEGGCPVCADAVKSSAPVGTAAAQTTDCTCVHAESNLVSYCAIEGIKLDGAIVYCTDHPCQHCVKLLASSGVREVVYDRDYPAPLWTRNLRRMTVRRFTEPTTKPDLPRVTASVADHAWRAGWARGEEM
jgi:dCMP deaminase